MPPIAPGLGAASEALLERADELSFLVESLDGVVRASRGRVVLVGGEAGVGKTALLRSFCDEVRGSRRVLWGSCDPLFTPRPLGPLIAVAADVGGEFEEVVEGEAMPHEVVAALVRELGHQAATVFVLEDVHWADEATLDVVRLLARRVETVPALVVLSYRDDELDNRHPLRVVLGELATSNALPRLKVAPFSQAAVAQLADPLGVDAGELYRKTAGNPFFVVEALAAGVGQIPDTVRDAVLARVAPLGQAAQTLLEAVAVIPRRAELWLLEAMVGEASDSLDECLASGMLAAEPAAVAFRHELARLAVEESVGPNRRIALNRKALAALAEAPGGNPDLARLAHHAEAAGDADAVLRFAPAAAARAASMSAHREAAAQYARALRFGDRLPLAERAELLEQRSRECYLTDQSDEAIEAIREALECRRALGQRLEEGDSLRWLSQILWCPGRTIESDRTGREAVALLETLPPGRELAMAYGNVASACAADVRHREAASWGGAELELAERLQDEEIAVHALATIGVSEFGESGVEKLALALERAQQPGLAEQAGRTFVLLAAGSVDSRRHAVANQYLDAGLDFCSERGLELFRLYLLGYRARLELDQGRWAEAADTAMAVIRVPRTSITPRILALVVLGLVRARRGDPEHGALLDEAWRIAEPTGELPRLGPVAAARAEAAWLAGDRDAVAAATEAALPLALDREAGSLIGQLVTWRRRAGLETEIPTGVPDPYALQLAGEPIRAAELWTEIGSPYEAALALADADDEEMLRRALDELQRLEARPAAAIVARRLRERGARGLPRGPRPATRENPYGLTSRELEVLELIAGGLRNAEIAGRLVLSERTVGHHVSAILRKLGVQTRAQAGAEAIRLGLTGAR